MRTLPLLPAALALALALPPAARAAPPEAPCVPVKPCEIPDDAGPAPADAPADLGAEARLLFELVACDGGRPPPGPLASDVAPFCARQRAALERFRAGPRREAAAFLAGIRPAAGLPGHVVQPFGADLLAVLTAYPDARNVTTLSPAPAGDPRALLALRGAALRAALDALAAATEAALGAPRAPGANASGPAAVLPLLLTALAAHDLEPVGLRYFRLEPDGTIRYLTAAELAAPAGAGEADRFAHAELTFLRRGSEPASARVHRHVAAGLSDAELARAPGVLRHLEAKGRFATFVRSAGDRLRREDHARVRALLAARSPFALSDWSGLPPAVAREAGLVQETYGRFERAPPGAGGAAGPLLSLWRGQPPRPLPVRLGEPDGAGNAHLLVTRRP